VEARDNVPESVVGFVLTEVSGKQEVIPPLPEGMLFRRE
jgi:hypothetical protein